MDFIIKLGFVIFLIGGAFGTYVLSIGCCGKPVCITQPDGCVGWDWHRPYNGIFTLLAGWAFLGLCLLLFRRWANRKSVDHRDQ